MYWFHFFSGLKGFFQGANEAGVRTEYNLPNSMRVNPVDHNSEIGAIVSGMSGRDGNN